MWYNIVFVWSKIGVLSIIIMVNSSNDRLLCEAVHSFSCTNISYVVLFGRHCGNCAIVSGICAIVIVARERYLCSQKLEVCSMWILCSRVSLCGIYSTCLRVCVKWIVLNDPFGSSANVPGLCTHITSSTCWEPITWRSETLHNGIHYTHALLIVMLCVPF